MYLYTGERGISLKNILKLYNQDFKTIIVRCLWKEKNQIQDELIGFCKYENNKLEPIDGDSYSLEDLYIKWEKINENELIVWEEGYLSNEWKDIKKGII